MKVVTLNLWNRFGDLAVSGCERVFVEPVDGGWVSDHFGVMADLEVL
jgi:hypothetical protein